MIFGLGITWAGDKDGRNPATLQLCAFTSRSECFTYGETDNDEIHENYACLIMELQNDGKEKTKG